jgi:hypothetical protein
MLPRISSNAVTLHTILEDLWIHETAENFLQYHILVMITLYVKEKLVIRIDHFSSNKEIHI